MSLFTLVCVYTCDGFKCHNNDAYVNTCKACRLKLVKCKEWCYSWICYWYMLFTLWIYYNFKSRGVYWRYDLSGCFQYMSFAPRKFFNLKSDILCINVWVRWTDVFICCVASVLRMRWPLPINCSFFEIYVIRAVDPHVLTRLMYV